MATLFFKYKYPNSTIIAFEPDERTFSFLKQNTEKLKGVQIIKAAVTSKSGKVKLYGNELTRATGTSSIYGKGQHQIVDSVKLSDYIINNVFLLKLDVEGAELEILQSIKSYLKRVREIVMEHKNDDNVHTILKILHDNGFRYTINYEAEHPLLCYKQTPYEHIIRGYREE